MFSQQDIIMGQLALITVMLALSGIRSTKAVNTLDSICYFPNWVQTHTVDTLDPSLCTHLIFAFAHIDGTNLAPTNPRDYDVYKEFNALKTTATSPKTLISIGGAGMGPDPFNHVSSTPELRTEFASNVVAYVKTHGFDGADIDWEYPNVLTKQNFTKLMEELKRQFDMNDGEKLLLTAALGVGQKIYEIYDVSEIHKYMDFANVMSYDMYGYWSAITEIGIHSALYGLDETDRKSQRWAINTYIEEGFSASKLRLGIPTFGRSFTLCSPSDNTIGDFACDAGIEGPYTDEKGILAFSEICKLVLNDGYFEVNETSYGGMYAYKGDQWAGYDDVYSTNEKIDFALEKGIGGIMFWDTSKDDFTGSCGQDPYPIIRQVAERYSQSNAGYAIRMVWIHWLILVFTSFTACTLAPR